MSDLDVVKACEAILVPGMIINKDKIIMSHVSQWPNEKARKAVHATQ